MRLLLDEMYPSALAEALRAEGIDALAVAEIGLAGRPDDDLLAAATADARVVLTENVGDFARIAADQLVRGLHHPGVLVALSSRFSRRPSGRDAIVAAVRATRDEPLADRVVYLERPPGKLIG